MWEMCEVIDKILLLGGLFGIAWLDYRTQLIKGGWLLLMGITGGIFAVLQGEGQLDAGTFSGVLIGIGILIFAYVSGESIGLGDGWLFVVTGTYLTFWENFVLLFGSMLLAGIFASICLILKRKNKNERMALAPFVLMGYVVFVL